MCRPGVACEECSGWSVSVLTQIPYWYLNLMDFFTLSERLYRGKETQKGDSPAISVLRDLGNTIKLPHKFIQDLFFVLRDAAFTYGPLPATQSKERNSKLFTDELLSQWTKEKADLKKMIKRHTEPVMTLRECQQNWWKSRAKMNQYANMLEAAQLSLNFNTQDQRICRARTGAIKVLKKDLASKQRKHARNMQAYEQALELEREIRLEIVRLSESLKESITNRINERIKEALAQLHDVSGSQSGFNIDVNECGSTVYQLTSRRYRFEEPSTDVQSSHIIIPCLDESLYESYESNITYASYNYTGRVTDYCLEFTEKHLKLKPGDNVKLKILSRGGRIGFGWTRPSRFSTKKWGFFPTMKITFIKSKSDS